MTQKQKLKQKKKEEQEEKQEEKEEEKEKKEKQKSKVKVALHALEKQVEATKLREILILAGFMGGAAALRVPMQALPSAEPITFFAILAGWLFGRKKGFAVGAGALYLSNFFVFGGQGPWTLFQALGFGLGGYIGGWLRGRSGYISAAIAAIGATLTFEIVMNAGSLLVFPGSWLLMITALPFIAIHFVSNILFALGLPKAKKFIEEKGGFNEKKLATDLIAKFKHRLGMSKQDK